LIKDCGFDAALGTCLLTRKPISSPGQARPGKPASAHQLIGGLFCLGFFNISPPTHSELTSPGRAAPKEPSLLSRSSPWRSLSWAGGRTHSRNTACSVQSPGTRAKPLRKPQLFLPLQLITSAIPEEPC